MPNMIDPATVTVLFADLQKGIVDTSETETRRRVIKAAAAMAKIADALGCPKFVTMVQAGPDAPELAGDLREPLADAPVFVRRSPHAFGHEPTSDAVKATGRNTVAICGVASEIVVLHAALGAIELGYTVYVLVDACEGLSERTEAAAFRQIERAGGVTTSVASFATSLVRDFTTPEGGAVIGAIMAMR